MNANTSLTSGTYRDSGRSDSRAKGAGYMAGNSADLSGGRGGGLSKGNKAIGR